jgi:hypothetical protein
MCHSPQKESTYPAFRHGAPEVHSTDIRHKSPAPGCQQHVAVARVHVRGDVMRGLQWACGCASGRGRGGGVGEVVQCVE